MRMSGVQIFALLLAICFIMPAAAWEPYRIYGGETNIEYLGCWNCGTLGEHSIWNKSSEYGWDNPASKWERGGFKRPNSDFSPCNDRAKHPPVIIDSRRKPVALLSISEITRGSICNAVRPEEAHCRALKRLCSRK